MNIKNYIEQLLIDIDSSSTILKDEHHGFLLSLIIISSYVIQADGKIMHSEMEYIREFLLNNYGIEKKEKYNDILLKLFAESKKFSHEEWSAKIKACAIELKEYTTERQRILLMSFLINIVKVDRFIKYTEITALREVAQWLDVDMVLSERIDNLIINEAWT